jgi:hypothetical protein
MPVDISVLIVDNGCCDKIEGPNPENKSVTVIRSEVNLGFGGAAKLASSVIPPNASLCWIPGNGKISLSNCLDWLQRQRKSPYAVAKALRSRRRGIEVLKSRVVDVFLTTVTGFRWIDVGGTPTVISSSLRESFFERAPSGIEIEAYTIAFCHRQSIRMGRSKITYGRRAFGDSSWRKGLRSEIELLRAFTKIALESGSTKGSL